MKKSHLYLMPLLPLLISAPAALAAEGQAQPDAPALGGDDAFAVDDDGMDDGDYGAPEGDDRAPRAMGRRGHGPRHGGWYRSAPLLPEGGDFALGIDAQPLFSWVGNAFNGSTSNSLFNDYPLPDAAVMGKYFMGENMAIRGRLRLTGGSSVTRFAVVEDGQNPADFDPSETVVDERYDNSFATTLAGGLEWRRGHGRLQGVYGGEAVIGYAHSSSVYAYGNDFDDDNPTPTTSTFNLGGSYSASSRVLESRPGNTLSLGVRGFLGAEFFMAPRVSIAGEFGYGLGIRTTGEGEVTTESWNAADEDTDELTFEQPKSFAFNLTTDNLSGALYLLVHF